MLLLAVAGAVFFALWWWRRQRRENDTFTAQVVFQTALTELESIRERADTLSAAQTATALSTLLKRAARQTTASADSTTPDPSALSGKAWLMWLDSRWSRHDFCAGTGTLLVDAAYRPQVDVDIDALFEVCRQWLETQQRVVQA